MPISATPSWSGEIRAKIVPIRWGSFAILLPAGVSSLEDALRDFQLRPVYDALRELIAPDVAEALENAKREETRKRDQENAVRR